MRLKLRFSSVSGLVSDSLMALIARAWIAQPDALLLRGPYLQSATPSSIVIRWRTDVPTDSTVLYGTVPVRGGVVIALTRMNRIVEIDPRDRVAVVQPGVINLALQDACAPLGLLYAPDPSSQRICTIGGMCATRASGFENSVTW